jgi:radical SAM superfamily enzyme YgiQ (UPF0313 family)
MCPPTNDSINSNLKKLSINVVRLTPSKKTSELAPEVDPFQTLLEERRSKLRAMVNQVRMDTHEEDADAATKAAWSTRSYPVIAVLAPVMSSHEGKIEFPGDPMCLYAALSVSISEVLKAAQADLGEGDPYNDLCPSWSTPPSLEYRLSCGDDTLRTFDKDAQMTDQTVFDPRVWNNKLQDYFANEVLAKIKPRVVLISTVSPGHRYAIAIAQEVRRQLPEALIVLGGRHIDETMRWDDQSGRLNLAYSSTLRAIDDGRIPPVIDFLASGDGYFALDILLKAISIAMDLEQKRARVTDVLSVLHQMLSRSSVPGRAVISALDGDNVHIFPIRGTQLDLSSLPSPYQFFAIRSRFPIFVNETGEVVRNAHMMVTNACPFRCDFCSEAVGVVGKILTFGQHGIDSALNRVFEYVSYGADSIFFDDSVFWAGSTVNGTTFCHKLARAREAAAEGKDPVSPWLRSEEARRRLARLQWGAQLTAEYMNSLLTGPEALRYLRLMREAGCNYIYIGIESLASTVMSHVHKNLSNSTGLRWSNKIVRALELAREAGIRVGSSVLFGLEGESRETIDETIAGVAKLLDAGLLWIASPNILTYHPGTAITRNHAMEESLDYHSINVHNRPPYVYFEEAFPAVVSRELSEEDIWYIHFETQKRWGQRRNLNPMPETRMPTKLALDEEVNAHQSRRIYD